MNTIYRIMYVLVSALFLFSCEKQDMPVDCGELCLTVEIGACTTKGENFTSEFYGERAVQSVEYYVFDSQGRLETRLTATNTSAVTARVSSGTKTVWAAVNIPSSRFSDVRTLSQFEAKEVSFDDFVAGRFPMSGKKSGVYVGTGSVSFSIQVERFVSRLCVAEITNALTGKFSGSSMELKGVFLSNVAGNCKVTGSAASTPLWYNRIGRQDGGGQNDFIGCIEDSSYADFTYGDTYNSVLEQDESFDDSFFMYFFPNHATSDVCGWSSSFTQRYTRVVTAIEIEGETYYYPVNLVGTLRNHAYTLYLTITHLGSLDPDTFDFIEIQDVVISIGGFDDFDDDFEIIY